MIDAVAKKLIEKNISISFAESCTGGSLASALTKVPGVSAIFKGSFVTYSEEYKERFLGVKDETIKEFGVVSSEVAEEMVNGLYDVAKAKICVSVTGNAGPTKGDDGKPVGRVYVGISYKGLVSTTELNLDGTREKIISQVIDFVFNEIDKLI